MSDNTAGGLCWGVPPNAARAPETPWSVDRRALPFPQGPAGDALSTVASPEPVAARRHSSRRARGRLSTARRSRGGILARRDLRLRPIDALVALALDADHLVLHVGVRRRWLWPACARVGGVDVVVAVRVTSTSTRRLRPRASAEGVVRSRALEHSRARSRRPTRSRRAAPPRGAPRILPSVTRPRPARPAARGELVAVGEAAAAVGRRRRRRVRRRRRPAPPPRPWPAPAARASGTRGPAALRNASGRHPLLIEQRAGVRGREDGAQVPSRDRLRGGLWRARSDPGSSSSSSSLSDGGTRCSRSARRRRRGARAAAHRRRAAPSLSPPLSSSPRRAFASRAATARVRRLRARRRTARLEHGVRRRAHAVRGEERGVRVKRARPTCSFRSSGEMAARARPTMSIVEAIASRTGRCRSRLRCAATSVVGRRAPRADRWGTSSSRAQEQSPRRVARLEPGCRGRQVDPRARRWCGA